MHPLRLLALPENLNISEILSEFMTKSRYKVKYLEKLEKQQVKECWHQNVTSCHDTFMTEFRPIQEKVYSFGYKNGLFCSTRWNFSPQRTLLGMRATVATMMEFGIST